jgi:hypothetical protein
MSRKTIVLTVLVLLASAAPAFACLWDSDTLQMERLRFPGVLEIITGKFVRHSKAYYEWRIVDRKQKLESKPNDPALIDDLAVAYAKLGRPEEGVPLLEQVLASRPNRYESLSNLGTLLFFAGRLDESKQHIRRALEINPDAHFGREQYQLLLTEYLQQSERETAGVMCLEGRHPNFGVVGFARFVIVKQFGEDKQASQYGSFDDEDWWRPRREELNKATKGVLGMMHFADFQSPVLLEALGDLLVAGGLDNDTLLAARAYLRAAQVSRDPAVSNRFEVMARQALINHRVFSPHMEEERVDLKRLANELQGELATADAWFTRIEAQERRWTADNKDVDREFAAVHYISLDETLDKARRDARNDGILAQIVFYGLTVGIPIAALLILTVGGRALVRRLRRPPTARVTDVLSHH